MDWSWSTIAGWKLLAMPQYAFCTNKISMKKLGALYASGGYDVFEVLDATILTLYYYQGEWRASSTKGYDIGSTKMFNDMTFMDAIYDLMETKYTSFKFEDLNTSYSYTIALRHSAYHIFDETKHLANRTKHVPRVGADMNSYIMVMRVADTSACTFVAKRVTGLPHQTSISINGNDINTLRNYTRSAYAKYEKAYTLENFKYKPLYGYILRAKHRKVPHEYSTIYIESELYRIIKLGIYKDNQYIRSKNYNGLVLKMYSTHDYFQRFRIMFQQFETKFQQVEKIVDVISAESTQRLIGGEKPDNSIYDNLISKLVEQFKDQPDVSPEIIKDAARSESHFAELLSYL